MKRTTVTIVLPVLALVGSKAWWATQLVDAGITQSYQGVSTEHYTEAQNQTLRLLPLVSRPGVTRAEILTTARLPGTADDSFEKDGFVWAGRIGLRFDAQGRLIDAAPSWSNGVSPAPSGRAPGS